MTNGNDLIKFVDDAQLRVKSLSTSVYVDPHKESVIGWDEALTGVRLILESWMEVQSKWNHLAPLFGSQILSTQLVLEVGGGVGGIKVAGWGGGGGGRGRGGAGRRGVGACMPGGVFWSNSTDNADHSFPTDTHLNLSLDSATPFPTPSSCLLGCSLTPTTPPTAVAPPLPHQSKRFTEVTRDWKKVIQATRAHCKVRGRARGGAGLPWGGEGPGRPSMQPQFCGPNCPRVPCHPPPAR